MRPTPLNSAQCEIMQNRQIKAFICRATRFLNKYGSQADPYSTAFRRAKHECSPPQFIVIGRPLFPQFVEYQHLQFIILKGFSVPQCPASILYLTYPSLSRSPALQLYRGRGPQTTLMVARILSSFVLNSFLLSLSGLWLSEICMLHLFPHVHRRGSIFRSSRIDRQEGQLVNAFHCKFVEASTLGPRTCRERSLT